MDQAESVEEQGSGALNNAWSRMFVIVNEATRVLNPSFNQKEEVPSSQPSIDTEEVIKQEDSIIHNGEDEDETSASRSNRNKRARIQLSSDKEENLRIITPASGTSSDDSSSNTENEVIGSSKVRIKERETSDFLIISSAETSDSLGSSFVHSDEYLGENIRRSSRRAIANANSASTVTSSTVSATSPEMKEPIIDMGNDKGKKRDITSRFKPNKPKFIKSKNQSNSSYTSTSLNTLMTCESAKGLSLSDISDSPSSHVELISPLLSSHIGRSGLIQHIMMLRTENIQKVARPLLSRIMQHPNNRGLFNEPVDVSVIVDYLNIIKHPIDLGTIKGRLLSFEYYDLDIFIGDIKRVFTNALKYNPPNNHVYNNANLMLLEFNEEMVKLKKKLLRDYQKRLLHKCSLCQGHECKLCGEKCLKLEPVMLMCNGTCNQRIKRSFHYYITKDGVRLWCHKCHTGLGSILPNPPQSYCEDGEEATEDAPVQYKRDLLKRMYDEDIPEPWVQCGACQDWFHQACALYNRFLDTASSSRSGSRSGEEAALPCFTCPLCRLGPEAARIPKPWVHRARDTNFNFKHEDEVTVSSSSLSSSQPASGVSFTLPSSSGDGLKHDDLITNDPNTTDESLSESEDREEGTEIRWDAPSLPTSHMTNFIEKKVRQRLREMGQSAVASSVHIRLITSVDRSFTVGSPILSNFNFQKTSSDKNASENIGYKCKSFAMFQKQDGTDICLFCMYVQEYNDESIFPSNRRCAYISYLDSIEYFRPRTQDSSLRTNVYHEIIISYLAWIRQRGFIKAHLWSCPPQRGNNFIFWCHPQHQRTPNKERLIIWYQNMCHVAKLKGVVTHVNNFYDEYFKPLLDELMNKSTFNAQSQGDEITLGDTKPEKKLTKKGKRMLNMAKIGRNGRGRGRTGWKGRATYGLDSNILNQGVGADSLSTMADNQGDEMINMSLKIETINETEEDECNIQFLDVEEVDVKKQGEEEVQETSSISSKLCPPLFEGDYWIEEAYRLYNAKHRKNKGQSDLDLNLTGKGGMSGKDKKLKRNPVNMTIAYQIITSFIKLLMKHSLSVSFIVPVDPVLLNIPDYFEIIKQPMDFTTINLKLSQMMHSHHLAHGSSPRMTHVESLKVSTCKHVQVPSSEPYLKVSDVLYDIELIFENAMTYNPPKHFVHEAASTLKQYYTKEWNQICNKWKLKQVSSGRQNNVDLNQELLLLKPICPVNNITNAATDISSTTETTASMDVVGGVRALRSNSIAPNLDSDGIEIVSGDSALSSTDASRKRQARSDDQAPRHASLVHSCSVTSIASSYNDSEYELYDDGVGNNSNDSSQFGAAMDDVQSMMKYLQDEHWLMRDVGKSVYKLKSDLLVLHLSPEAAPNMQTRKQSKKAYDLYIGGDDRAVVDILIKNKVNQTSSSSSSSSSSSLQQSNTKDLLISFNDNDPDIYHLSRPLMDGRHTMLEVCMFKHLQFDTLRRAKHATSMLLYYLHFPICNTISTMTSNTSKMGLSSTSLICGSNALNVKCTSCYKVIQGLRWHCSICTDYDVCSECNDSLEMICQPLKHPLTPYHVSCFD